MKNNPKINAVLIEDKEVGGYTGYIHEEPGVIAEGKTIEETIEALQEVLPFFMEAKAEAEAMG